MNALLEEDIRNGNALAPGETVVWAGNPEWRRVARDAVHLRGISAYFGLLFVLDAYQAWMKAIPLQQALHDSVPLVAITALALAILTATAWMIGRSRYTITNRRVILRYGLALPATLSIPMSQVAGPAGPGLARDRAAADAALPCRRRGCRHDSGAGAAGGRGRAHRAGAAQDGGAGAGAAAARRLTGYFLAASSPSPYLNSGAALI